MINNDFVKEDLEDWQVKIKAVLNKKLKNELEFEEIQPQVKGQPQEGIIRNALPLSIYFEEPPLFLCNYPYESDDKGFILLKDDKRKNVINDNNLLKDEKKCVDEEDKIEKELKKQFSTQGVAVEFLVDSFIDTDFSK
jgi:hypothetical protein